MKKYFCEYESGKLYVYTIDKSGKKKIISTDSKDIIKGIKHIAHFNTYVKLSSDDIELFCPNEQISMIILNYEKVLSDEKNREIEESIYIASKNGFIRKDNGYTLSKPKKGNSFVIKRVASLLVAGCISLLSLSPLQANKKNTNKFNSNNTIETNVIELTQPLDNNIVFDTLQEQPTDEIPNNFVNITNEETSESEINQEREVDISSEKEDLMQYFNVDSTEKVDAFLNEFIATMSRYNQNYNLEDIINIFKETKEVPLEEKIEEVKTAFNLDDKQIDAVAATLIAEGVGWGEKYIDVYAATTTALNHLQFPIWVYSISNVRGEELGHSLYGHTCYKFQFNAYDSDNYYTFLGNRTLTGYKSVIDTLYINSVYGLLLHDYTQFRGAWIDVPGGKIYEDGGNKYMEALKPEDRIVTEPINKNSTL